MNKLANWIQRFMAGRNGQDPLNTFLMTIYIILFVVNLFFHNVIISWIDIVVIILWMFRFYSRNVGKRQRENAWFMKTIYKMKNVVQPVITWFKNTKRKTKTVKPVKQKKPKAPKLDKQHIYKTCPVCANEIRVRKIKGERYVLCKHCHNEVKISV